MKPPMKSGQKAAGRDGKGRFTTGNGCSRGRPTGPSPATKLRARLAEDLDQIIDALREQAVNGDLVAIRILLDRVLPALKPVELPATVALPANGTLSDQARSVVASIADGRMAPSEGATVLGALASLGKIIETDELASRIAALEAQGGHR